VHVLGDRRDHFESLDDVWEIFRLVARERKRREIDATVKVVGECVEDAHAGKGDPFEHRRLKEMFDFLSVVSGLFDETLPLSAAALRNVTRLRGKVVSLFGKQRTGSGR
jgi:DNA-binding transcriptional regulator GbsR (MarR family)